MPRYRSLDVGFKRQVAQEFLTGESLNRLSRKYDVARNLILGSGVERSSLELWLAWSGWSAS
jgi:hypothetical protein